MKCPNCNEKTDNLVLNELWYCSECDLRMRQLDVYRNMEPLNGERKPMYIECKKAPKYPVSGDVWVETE